MRCRHRACWALAAPMCCAATCCPRWPHALGTLLAFTTAQAVLALAALGFVGVGAQAPTAELGLMITEAMPYYREAPWLIAAPTAVLLWLVAAMMLIQPEREAA